MIGFLITLIVLQLMFWFIGMVLSDPKSDNKYYYKSKREVGFGLLRAFVPFLPIVRFGLMEFKKYE